MGDAEERPTTASLTLDLAAKMLASRVGVAATRSAAKPFMAQNLPKLALAARVPATQYRPIATVKQTPAEGNEILAKQRLNRPVSPHLGIYKMNQTWLGSSAWTRITGCALSGGSYLVAPLFGWHLESASLAAAFAGMPFIVNGGIKFLLGFPFAMHFFNGVKHLVLDTGRGFAKASVVRVETAAWTFGILGGLFLAFGL